MGLGATALLLLIGGLAAITNADPLARANFPTKWYFTTVETGCDERCVCYYLLRHIDYANKVSIAVPIHVAHCKAKQVEEKGCQCTRVQKKYLPCTIKVSKCQLSDPNAHPDDCTQSGCICEYFVKAGIWIFDKLSQMKVEKVIFTKQIFNAPYDFGCRNDMYSWCTCKSLFSEVYTRPVCELHFYTCESFH